MFVRSRGCLLALATLVPIMLAPEPVVAGSGCSYDAASETVTVALPESESGIKIRRVGDALWAGAYDCEGATRFNTDTIQVDVTDVDVSLDLEIDLEGGAFRPGATPESGSSEIEFRFHLTTNSGIHVLVRGGEDSDNFRAGSTTSIFAPRIVNLNAGESTGVDGDLFISGDLERLALVGDWGEGSGDVISAAGGAGTGDPYDEPIGLAGGGGADTITGGIGADNLWGSDGRDVARGGRGPDTIGGGRGADMLLGARGGDQLSGNEGDDELDGGPGTDSCDAGAGDNKVRNCE